ncbi:NIPSNAP family protein [Mycobacterium paraterrae]|uniref:NIPSNAP family protein n=1 Tax=Mycobacterium paraterrae TaxID=577492 RepID=A0ABY3VLF6_9MYCO|nr:NIPSNAP family protein [Mycobacterium paraterrae]UMB68328.1 NIPSNAP family protein [Mycobacterium paraterrae]
MLYEVREYVAVPGRLPAVIELFNEATIPLFAKHGMELVHVGRTSVGPESLNELVYTLRFDDIAEMQQKWTAFLHDPEWVAAAAAKEAEGPMLQTIRRRLLDPGPFQTASGTHSYE